MGHSVMGAAPERHLSEHPRIALDALARHLGIGWIEFDPDAVTAETVGDEASSAEEWIEDRSTDR